MSAYLIYAVGFVAQLLFSARLLIQWISSERAKKLLSPVIFWQLSMVASLMLCIYGWLRQDFAVIFGQVLAYYIYVWNLNIKGAWKRIHILLRVVFISVPIICILSGLLKWEYTVDYLFISDSVSDSLTIFGVVGQSAFTLRFIYQILYSRKMGESLLPVTFWVISFVGSALIIIYGVIRLDYPILIGQSFGILIYARNIWIGLRERRLGA